MFGRKFNTSEQDIWITSDLHFHHKGVLSFQKETRPFKDVDDMNESLIKEWNSLVKPKDFIFHLGDFSFKCKEETSKVLEQLNGKKILLFGNHDKTLRKQFRVGEYDIVYLSDYIEVRIDEVKICMSHFPMVCHNQSGRGSIMLHGHCHGSYQGKGRTVDVGYDKYGNIINIKEAIDFCLERDVYSPDQHETI